MNHPKICFILFFLCLACKAAVINLQGYIPTGITALKMQNEYHRIISILKPSDSISQKPITIIYYSVKAQRKLGIRLPEWGGGGALGLDSIIIPIDKPYAFYPEDFLKITIHELVHIALARSYHLVRIPRWFHEGLAMSLSGEVSLDEGVVLSKAITFGQFIALDSIEYVNRFSQYKAQIAYCESHFAVQYLNKLYGYDMLPELLDSAAHERKFDSACVKVFGLTVKEYEHILKTEIAARYRYTFIFTDFSFLWILIVLLAVTAFIVTLIRNRNRRKILDAEENQGGGSEGETEISGDTEK